MYATSHRLCFYKYHAVGVGETERVNRFIFFGYSFYEMMTLIRFNYSRGNVFNGCVQYL